MNLEKKLHSKILFAFLFSPAYGLKNAWIKNYVDFPQKKFQG